MRLAEIELRYRLSVMGNNREDGQEIRKIVRYLGWKIDFATMHGMLNSEMIADDLSYLQDMLLNGQLAEEHDDNVQFFETIAYLKKSVIPAITLSQDFNLLFLDQLPNLVKTIGHFCKSTTIFLPYN